MPRNASGTYSLPQSPFTPNTTIQSSPVNSNFSDIASALTQSLATTGVSGMTGPIQAADGSVTAPSYTFGSALGTGFFLESADSIGWAANGVLGATFNADGTVNWEGLATFIDVVVEDDLTVVGDTTLANTAIVGTATLNGNALTNFPAATVMAFRNATPPTGWTQITSNIDGRAIRLSDGNPSTTGGSVLFENAFFDRSTEGYTLLVADIPLHGHPFRLVGATGSDEAQGGIRVSDGTGRVNHAAFTGTPSDTAGEQIGGTGGGGSHSHDIDLGVFYLEMLLATKDA